MATSNFKIPVETGASPYRLIIFKNADFVNINIFFDCVTFKHREPMINKSVVP